MYSLQIKNKLVVRWLSPSLGSYVYIHENCGSSHVYLYIWVLKLVCFCSICCGFYFIFYFVLVMMLKYYFMCSWIFQFCWNSYNFGLFSAGHCSLWLVFLIIYTILLLFLICFFLVKVLFVFFLLTVNSWLLVSNYSRLRYNFYRKFTK